MKTLVAMIAVLISNIAFATITPADQVELDGKSYCRTVATSGLFGQPQGERLHCIWFSGGSATDNANTFFGNPPESAPYYQTGDRVTFGTSEYTISADGTTLTTVTGSAVEGTVLTLQ